jgi:hypothetical protein
VNDQRDAKEIDQRNQFLDGRRAGQMSRTENAALTRAARRASASHALRMASFIPYR